MSAANGVLRNFTLFVDGLGYAGNVPTLTPPALAIKTEEFMAGGLDAPIAIDMGQEKMEGKYTLSDQAADAISTWGVIGGPDFTYNFRGALQNLDGSVDAIAIYTRGRTRSITPEQWQAGQARANVEYVLDLNYYRMDVDGVTVIEIDVVNGTRIIGGVDQLANIRTALGI